MARENAIVDRPLAQRKAHVRAPVVQGVDLPPVMEDGDGAPSAGRHYATLPLQVGHAAHANETSHVCSHLQLSRDAP